MFNFFKKLWASISDWMLNYITSNIGQIVSKITETAWDVVKKVEIQNPDKSGSEKFDEAKKILIMRLTKMGIKYTTKTLHTAIEIAVDWLEETGQERKKDG